MLDYIHACARAATDPAMTFSQHSAQSCRQITLFPIEYRFNSGHMRAILPISCSLLRSWTVLPSGL